MKSTEKFLLDDLRKTYKGKVNTEEILKNCYLDTGESIEVIKCKKITYVVMAFAFIIALVNVVLSVIFVINSNNIDKLNLSKVNEEYMLSICDDIIEVEAYKISLTKDDTIYIYSGIDHLEDNAYQRIYFYVVDSENDEVIMNLYLNNQAIQVKDDNCGILAIVEDENGMKLEFKVEIDGIMKEYKIDLFK